MSFKTTNYKLADVINLIGGGTPKRNNPDFWGGEIPWLSVVDFNSDSRFVNDSSEKITQYGLDNSSTRLLEKGQLIISARGTIGCLAQLTKSMAFNQSCYGLTGRKGVIENDYLYYLLKLKISELRQKTHGAVFDTITRETFKYIEVQIPDDPKIRETIAKTLGDIDNKIQLNHQTNQTLEAIAQAIFKSWFVDFDPVKAKITTLEAGGSQAEAEQAAMMAISAKSADELAQMQADDPEAYQQLAETAALFPAKLVESELGLIPEGWEVEKLSVMLEFNPKLTLKKTELAPYLDMKNVPTQGHLAEEVVMREFKSGTKFTNGDTLLARITPCLENGKTAFVDFLKSNEIGWGSTEFIIIRPTKKYPASLGYFLARNESFRNLAIQSMTGTSGRQRSNAKALQESKWLVYPPKLMNVFEIIASRYLKTAKSNGDENKILASLRDTLLPKLLSGEIDLSQLPTEENVT